MGDESIDTVILYIGMGYLVTLLTARPRHVCTVPRHASLLHASACFAKLAASQGPSWATSLGETAPQSGVVLGRTASGRRTIGHSLPP